MRLGSRWGLRCEMCEELFGGACKRGKLNEGVRRALGLGRSRWERVCWAMAHGSWRMVDCPVWTGARFPSEGRREHEKGRVGLYSSICSPDSDS